MFLSRLAVPALLISLSLFPGVAGGQGSNGFQQQGPQPLQGGITGQDQWLQPLQNNMANQGQQIPNVSKSRDKAGSKAKNLQAQKVTGTKQTAKRPFPKPILSGFSTSRSVIKRVQRPQLGHSGVELVGMGGKQDGGSATVPIGTGGNPSGSHNSTSFLDGYLLRSVHDSGLAHKDTNQNSFLDGYLLRSLHDSGPAHKNTNK